MLDGGINATDKLEMSKVTEVLIKARDLISDPSRWTQRSFAKSSDGKIVRLDSDCAVCFCADGALAKMSGVEFDIAGYFIENEIYITTSRLLRGVVPSVAKSDSADSYICLNDGVYPIKGGLTTHQAILKAFDLAIEHSRQLQEI